MTPPSPILRWWPIVNLVILCAAYARLWALGGGSRSFAVVLLAGGAAIAAVAVAAISPGVRAAWGERVSRTGVTVRSAMAVSPWVGIALAAASRPLWWTQRPGELRFLVAWALVSWSIAWCAATAGWRPPNQTQRATFWLAAVLAAFGIQGLAFGVTPLGCGLSAVIAVAAAVALCVGRFASTPACLKLFAASAATVLAVAIIEATVRLSGIGQNVQEVDSREFAREFYSLTPPRAAFVNPPTALDEFGPALIEINSLGIRGPEIPDPRADVLLIGDSMIEARQLPWEQTLGPRLQRELDARSPGLRVISHGMRGWSPLLEWNWYLKVGRRFGARIVILSFFWNDLWTAGDEATTFRAVLRPDGRPVAFDVPVDANWIWYKRVRTVRLVADVWRRLSVGEIKRAFSTVTRERSSETLGTADALRLARRLTEPPLPAADVEALLSRRPDDLDPHLRPLAQRSFWPSIRPYDLWTDAQRAAAAITEQELQRFAEDVASNGGRLVLLFVPNPLQLSADECVVGRLFERVDTDVVLPPTSGIQDWIRGVAGRHRIELLDPSAAMREHIRQAGKAGDPLYLRADCHWSARGHQFMAGYLAEWLTRQTSVQP